MNRTFLGLTLSGLVAVALAAGCAESNASTKTSNGSGTETGAGGSGEGGGATTTTTGGGGATGSGGGSTGTGGGSTGTGGGSTTTTSTTGTGGGGQSGTPGDHLVLSEIAVSPAGLDFIEVYNPTNAEVDLTDYYLSDNSTYWTFAAGQAWDPPTDNPGTDFLARFPKGAKLAAGAVLVVAFDPKFKDADTGFGACPDYALKGVFDGCQTAAMNAPVEGAIGASVGLSDSREMVVLFRWDGDTSHNAEDVDYVTWGAKFEDATRVDKTGQGSYKADTARASQKAAAAPNAMESIERCKLDSGETLSGGNGITGHDETSEDLATSFSVQAAPSPGQKNGCL